MKRIGLRVLGICVVLSVVFAISTGAETLDYSSKEVVKTVQERLNEVGYDCGEPDGLIGKKTLEAISKYKQDHGISGGNEIDASLYDNLVVDTEGENSQTSDLFPEAFEHFGSLIGQGIYEDILAYVSDKYPVFEATVPSEYELGRIVIN